VPVPDGLDARTAAAALVQGMTVHYLLHDCYAVGPGDWVLVHAGAGGTGGLLVQMAKGLGATVVATASTAEKQAVARANGADQVVDHAGPDFAAAVRALPGFPGFAAVYDSIGQATFEAGLGLLRRRGAMVVYGAASGPVPPFDINRLNPMGSLVLMRPNLKDFVATRGELVARAEAVFRLILDGRLTIRIGACLPLADAARAHELLQSRRSTGKLLLIP
jgi:NADPH2:quinone reductase